MAVLMGGYPTLFPALVPHPIQARGRVGGKETVIRMHCLKNSFFFFFNKNKTKRRKDEAVEEVFSPRSELAAEAEAFSRRRAHKHAFTNGGELQLHQLGCVFIVTAACSLGVLTRVQVWMSLCMCMCESLGVCCMCVHACACECVLPKII